MNTVNHAAVRAAVQQAMIDRAHRAFPWLIDALSHEGTGLWHEGNPRRSSTPDEYPAPQTEALLGSIDVRVTAYNTLLVGSFEDRDATGFSHAVELESRPPSQGGRAFLEMALIDPDLHAELRRP